MPAMIRGLCLMGLMMSVLAGCTCGTQTRTPTDGGGHADGGGVGDTHIDVNVADSGGFDPFDPRNTCGSHSAPTDRVPGAVMIVLDYSGSMGAEIGTTSQTRWAAAANAVRAVVNALPDDMQVGLVRFPTASCTVANSPTVPVARLSQSRAAILAATNPSAVPAAENLTPISEALQRGYAALAPIQTMGGKGLVLVTDGDPTCGVANRAALAANVTGMINAAQTQLAGGVRTFVVGLEIQSGFMSELAVAGGTRRAPACNPRCDEWIHMGCQVTLFGITCEDSSRSCNQSTGYCGCVRDSDCGDMRTCTNGSCRPSDGNTMCCNYSISGNNFQTDFQQALTDITSGFRGECTFDVPRDPTPGVTFDPNLVNVGVTFIGQSRVVLTRVAGASTSANGWYYTGGDGGDHRTIEVTGPICDQLRTMAANVEVVLGCPSIIP